MPTKGQLFLVPCSLGSSPITEGAAPDVASTLQKLDGFFAENPKTCRAYLKQINCPKALSDYQYHSLNKKTSTQELIEFIQLLEQGLSFGIMSEAGCPGIADPGSKLVALAHEQNIPVVPLIGPSSIIMALMASGLNGQSFAFHGYLPIQPTDLQKRLKAYISRAQHGESQLVMDTPYRNNKLFKALISTLPNDFKLCIAANISQEGEWIKTKTVAAWKKQVEPNIHKVPAMMVFGCF